MLLMYLFFASWYFIPVIILICIPNRLIWLIAATILLCLSPYRAILAEIDKPKIAAMVFVVIFPALLMKALAIWMRGRGKISLARALPFIGLAGPIFLLSNINKFEEFFTENPISQSCVMNVLRPQIDGYNFLIPPINMFNIEHNIENQYFQKSKIGALCELTDNGNKIFTAESITFSFPSKYNKFDFCRTNAEGWEKIMCNMDDDLYKNVDYQTKISIFKKGQSELQNISDLPKLDYDSTFKHLEKEKDKAWRNPENRDFYILNNEEIWITKDTEWKTPDGNLYATSCSQSSNGTICITSYPLNDKLTLRYSFITTYENIKQRAMRVDKVVNEVVATWMKPTE